MNLLYISLRLIRHFMPPSVARFLLNNQLIIQPGLETRAPHTALGMYLKALEAEHFSLQRKNVLVFGYGGTFTIGCAFLEAGAQHVTLLDYFVKPNQQQNRVLLSEYGKYLKQENGEVLTHPKYLAVIDGDVREVAAHGQVQPVDLIVSNSVYEHLEDVDGITRALAKLTKPDGLQLHFIDLRDHFFRYPFEMLTYTEQTWKRWLNPTSNLNRYRWTDYKDIFEKHFETFDLTILDSDPEAFSLTKSRIRTEFLTGDLEIDTVISLQVVVKSPRTVPPVPK